MVELESRLLARFSRSLFGLEKMTYSGAKRIIRNFWFVAIIVVIVGSLLPGSSSAIRLLDRLHINDKIEHLLAYCLLTFLPATHERRGVVIASAAGAVLLGIGLEYAQLFSGWRDFETGDMLADTLGVLLGGAAGIPMRSVEMVRPLLAPINKPFRSGIDLVQRM